MRTVDLDALERKIVAGLNRPAGSPLTEFQATVQQALQDAYDAGYEDGGDDEALRWLEAER